MTTEEHTEPTPAQMLIDKLKDKQTAVAVESPPAAQTEVSRTDVFDMLTDEEREMVRLLTKRFFEVAGEPTLREQANCMGMVVRGEWTRQGQPSVHVFERPVGKPRPVAKECDHVFTADFTTYINRQRCDFKQGQVLIWADKTGRTVDAQTIRHLIGERATCLIPMLPEFVYESKRMEAQALLHRGGLLNQS